MQRNRFFFAAENGPSSPDIGKRHFNETVARKFGILPPSGLWRASACYFTNTSSLFSAIQIHILHLQSCGHVGPMEATCRHTNNRVQRCVWECVYEQQVWKERNVDIRYEELMRTVCLIIVAYNQGKGVCSSRLFWPGHWPPHRFPNHLDVMSTKTRHAKLVTQDLIFTPLD